MSRTSIVTKRRRRPAQEKVGETDVAIAVASAAAVVVLVAAEVAAEAGMAADTMEDMDGDSS